MTAEFASRLRPSRQGASRRRRFGEKIRRQRGADVPVARHSDTVAKEPSGQTLETLLVGAWEDLTAGCRAECPVCGGQMAPARTSAAVTGTCADCGTQLS